MNWVAPIKDEETLVAFGEALKDIDEKYYYHGLATVGGTIGTSNLLVVLGYIVLQTGLIALFTAIFGV